MKNTYIFLFFNILITPLFAQVGIGTTTPESVLDIRASSQASPTSNDGILIPKIDEFPIVNPTISQDGMMVFVTGNGTPTKGFYYWDEDLTSWINIRSIERIDDLDDGKSDNDGTNDGSSIFLGVNAGENDDATNNGNIGIGWEALLANIDGNDNIAIGNSTLTSNVSGFSNIGIGREVLYNNLGNGNIGIGFHTLFSNTTGNDNIAIGFDALNNNTIGVNNNAFGSQALRENSIGFFNNAFGRHALQLNTIGSGNTAVGHGALRDNTDGNNNTALGNSAGDNVNGFDNVFLGRNAGLGLLNSTNSGNVVIGSFAGSNASYNNRLYIDNTNTANPLLYGEFDNNLLRVNGTLDINNAYQLPITDGTSGQALVTDGTGNVDWGSITNVERINDLLDGKSDNDGTDDGSSIFLGIDSGLNDDGTDNRNIGIGINALRNNTTGANNTGIGYNALGSNIDGNDNTGIGWLSLASNTTGYVNTALGAHALGLNAVGIGNVAVGSYSLSSNTDGHSNVGIGYAALNTSTIGTGNIAIGFESLHNNTGGNYNIAIGSEALRFNTAGFNNVTLGSQAGYSNILGNGNIFLGNEAGFNELGSNRLYIENSNADSSNALIYGEFDNNFLRFNANVLVDNGNFNVDNGVFYVDQASNRVGIGTLSPDYRFAVNGLLNLNEDIGGASVALRVNGSEALWYNGTYFSWGFGAASNFFARDVGIGVSNPNVELDVIGSIEYTGTITDVSDKRLKENFKEIDNALNRIQALKGYSYNMIDDSEKKREYGVIAQDVKKVFPEMVSIVDKEKGYLGVSYIQLIPVLLEAIKEQEYNNNKLKEQICY